MEAQQVLVLLVWVRVPADLFINKGVFMAKTIYVVYGERGEYDDHSKWNVRAYSKKEDADKHAADASEWSRQRVAQVDANKPEWSWNNKAVNPFDPTDPYPDNETEYGVEELQYGRKAKD